MLYAAANRLNHVCVKVGGDQSIRKSDRVVRQTHNIWKYFKFGEEFAWRCVAKSYQLRFSVVVIWGHFLLLIWVRVLWAAVWGEMSKPLFLLLLGSLVLLLTNRGEYLWMIFLFFGGFTVHKTSPLSYSCKTHLLNNSHWGEKVFSFSQSFLFLLLRSGVLKEYVSGGQRSAQRRNRTNSDSSVYDTERKT